MPMTYKKIIEKYINPSLEKRFNDDDWSLKDGFSTKALSGDTSFSFEEIQKLKQKIIEDIESLSYITDADGVKHYDENNVKGILKKRFGF